MKQLIRYPGLLLVAGSVHAALSINPTSLYTFDTGNGTTDSMGTLNLSVAGTTTSGLFGTGANASSTGGLFKGPTNTADPSTSALTQPGTGDFSLSFWYKAGAANPTTYAELLFQGGLWNGGPYQTAGYTFELRNSGVIQLHTGDYTSSAARTDVSSTASVNLGAWNNLAMVRSGDLLTLYLNGVAYTSALTSGYNIAVNNAGNEWYREFSIGKSPVGSGGTIGSVIDDVGVWKGSALTAGDIAQIYNNGAGASISSLMAVPEPSTYGLLGAAALAATAFVRRRRKA